MATQRSPASFSDIGLEPAGVQGRQGRSTVVSGSLQPLSGLRRLMWEAGYPAAGCHPATA